MENLRTLKLDKNLGIEIQWIEGESASLLSLDESRIRMQTEISQRPQELNKHKRSSHTRRRQTWPSTTTAWE